MKNIIVILAVLCSYNTLLAEVARTNIVVYKIRSDKETIKLKISQVLDTNFINSLNRDNCNEKWVLDGNISPVNVDSFDLTGKDTVYLHLYSRPNNHNCSGSNQNYYKVGDEISGVFELPTGKMQRPVSLMLSTSNLETKVEEIE